MIVFYKKENTLSLPYNEVIKVQQRNDKNLLIYNDDGSPRLINKDTAKYFKFIPGKNVIPKDIWLKIAEYNKEDWDYYRTILTVFRPVVDNKTDQEIGEDNINLKDVSEREFKELIENTMDLGEINKYSNFEKNSEHPRKRILNAITKRKSQITKADEALAGKKEEE